MPDPIIIQKYEDFNDVAHWLAAKYVLDNAGNPMTWDDIKALNILQTKSVTRAEWETTLYPNPSVNTEDIIFLVPSTDTPQPGEEVIQEMWLTTHDDSVPPVYSWVSLGSTSVDLSNYSQKTHTHTVTPQSMALSATADGVTIGATSSGTANVVGSIGAPTTKEVLGANTTFTPTVTTLNEFLKASSSNVTLQTDGTATVATGIDTTTANALTTSTTFNTSVTPTTTKIKASATAGSITSTVDENGVLSFSISAPAVTLSSGSTGDVTVATGITSASTTATGSTSVIKTASVGNNTATVLTGVSVKDQPEISLSKVSASGAGIVSVATGIDTASISVTEEEVNAVTGIGTITPTTVLTAVEVKTQPTVKLNNSASVNVAAPTQVTTSQASE